MGEGSGGTGGWTMRGQKRAGGGSMHSLSTWKKQRRVSEGTRNVFQRRIQCFVGVVGVVVGVLAAHCCEVGESRVCYSSGGVVVRLMSQPTEMKRLSCSKHLMAQQQQNSVAYA